MQERKNSSEKPIVDEKNHPLVKRGWEYYYSVKKENVQFVEDVDANAFLNELQVYPHAFVLACVMDRQIKAERAWMIPSRIKDFIGGGSIYDFARISPEEYTSIFVENSLHRFNETMAEAFYNAVYRIVDIYDGDASKIWSGEPSSAAVVYRFMQFKGVGMKIATMATNILARDFKIRFSDYYSIDVSTDTHIRRVMRRIGLVPESGDNDMIRYKARELCPEFPGIIDYPLWEIGREWCHPKNPECDTCVMNHVCANRVSITED